MRSKAHLLVGITISLLVSAPFVPAQIKKRPVSKTASKAVPAKPNSSPRPKAEDGPSEKKL
jgi:hypothetical protein